jgi:hypothetical protein
MARYRYPIPDNLDPNGDICIPVSIPNDYEYISIFRRHIADLLLDRVWERDEDNSALVVREIWKERTYVPLIDSLINLEECGTCSDTLASCFHVGTTSEGFKFYPNDPFTNEVSETIGFGYTWRRWEDTDAENSEFFQSLEDHISNAFGYYPNDCIVFPSQIADFAFLNIAEFISLLTFQTFPFPYVQFDLEGQGEIEIELVNFPLGCSVLLIPDMELSWQGLIDAIIEIIDLDGELPSGWVFTELNRDLLQIPPETAATQSQEIQFSSNGTHNLTVIFMPRLNDEFPFFFPFGGIREIELCGNLKLIGSQTGGTIDKVNAGLGQHTRNGVVGMSTVEDICQGVLCALGKAGALISAGNNSGIELGIDSEGNIIVNDDSSQGGGTASGTAAELKAGKALSVVSNIQQVLVDMDGFYASYSGDANRDTIVQYYMELLYDVPASDAEWLNMIDIYFNYRDTPSAAYNIDEEVLGELMFCEGITKQTVNRWAITNAGGTLDDMFISMLKAISDAQFQQWIVSGESQPRTDYLAYACSLRADNERSIFDLTANTAEYVDLFGYENTTTNRLIRLTVSGKFVDSGTGNELDIRYIKDSSGNLTNANWLAFGFSDIGSANHQMFPPDELPYSENNVYQWTAEVPPDEYDGFVYKPANLAWISSAVGQIDILVEDLGKV